MDLIEEYRRMNARKASVGRLREDEPTGDPLSTHLCLDPLGLPGEDWPEHDGEALQFVCQLNLTEAPVKPDSLSDVALITLFVSEDPGEWGQENGDGWCLRAYASTDGLVPLSEPGPTYPCSGGVECTWEECDDIPCADNEECVLPEGLYHGDVEDLESEGGLKLGGWPYPVQDQGQWWDDMDHPARPAYCIQVDSQPDIDLLFGDYGAIYIGRGTAPGCEGRWFLDWACG